MSRMLPGEQVEHAFNSKRLNNWESPADDKNFKVNTTMKGTKFSTMRPRTGRTEFIVDEKGHLLPGVPKTSNAFNHPPYEENVYMKTFPRWPKINAAIPFAGNSTMGYKGIKTDYLPTSTVTLKAVEVQGGTERNYNFM